MNILIVLGCLITGLNLFAAIEYPATVRSASEAVETRALRAQKIIDQYAALPLAKTPTPPKVGFAEFVTTSIARMIKGVELAEVSANLLSPSFKPWNVGTDLRPGESLCHREGDFDFILMGLLRMAYLDLESGDKLLTGEARTKLRHVLLSQKGVEHHIKFSLKNCAPIKITDSENHIMMIEFSRYLTNQLLFRESKDPTFDNSKNGFEEWLLTHLSQFLREDFDELNSRPYQGYTLIALATLASYAEGPRVKTLATMILDSLSAKMAIQSKGLRRYPPFRRQKKYRETPSFTDGDNGAAWFSFHAGNTDYRDLSRTPVSINDYTYFMAATDRYEVPSLVLELFFDQSVPFFQKLKARDVEIYHNSPSFLLSSGGRFRKVFGYLTRENDVWPMPTLLIPKSHATTVDEVFALFGEKAWEKKNNLCVAPGFACGSDLRVPKTIPVECVEKKGSWTFYNFKDCSLDLGFHLATYELKGKAFWEVRESQVPFTEFRDQIIKANEATKFQEKKENTFVTSDGRRIVFDWTPTSLDTYPIRSAEENSDTRTWPLAKGNVISSKGDGFVRIQNPVTSESLILDQREVLNPKRHFEK